MWFRVQSVGFRAAGMPGPGYRTNHSHELASLAARLVHWYHSIVSASIVGTSIPSGNTNKLSCPLVELLMHAVLSTKPYLNPES